MSATTWLTGEPYRLAGTRMAFASWYYVRPAGFGWYDEQGRNVAVGGDQGPDGARFGRTDDPVGVRLAVRPASKTGELLSPERPWEAGGVDIGTVMRDGSLYRAWGTTGWGDLKEGGENYFVYFESDDAVHWRRPDCGLVEVAGDKRNNVLGRFGGSVFVDPSCPPAERYKWISEAHFPKEVYEAYVRRRPEAVDPRSHRVDADLYIGVRGAVSPDGVRWSVIDQPLVMRHSDTQNICYYDPVLGKYVAYMREFAAGPRAESGTRDLTPQRWLSVGRRAIARAETDDFRHFPLGETLLEPAPWMSFSETLYTNCRTTIPRAPEVPVMFPTVWDQATDSTWVAMATGHDGRAWQFIPHARMFETGSFGGFDGGSVFAHPELLEMPNGDFALPYSGYDVPHKYPRRRARRGFGYAVWPRGRLIGIEASERGAFSTVGVIASGGRIRINAETRRAGCVLVEAAGLDGKAIGGREFENCVPLFGDCFGSPVRWKGHDDLGVAAGEPVILRFRMEAGSVYCVDFE
ncbi:MAG: hypothetical protein GXY33_07135 [Phycisphaerae bacterium]|nr:hypothetical protein [Phycisphaerae bacterium]